MKFFEDEAKNTQFIKNNLMGPNALIILKELLDKLKLNKNMRILDLGCGTGLTSVCLAKETGAQIFAADLWISATDNLKRFTQLGLEKQIFPLQIDAAKPMPFAEDFFDAVISIDAYYYFGTAAGYLDKNIVPLVKKGGVIAIGIPGRKDENDAELAAKMEPYLQGEKNFHSLQWWKDLWQKSKNIEITAAFSMQCHEQAWQDWLASGHSFVKHDIEMMKADSGKYFDTIGLAAEVIKAENNPEPASWWQKLLN
ncbi:cyclopropane fatty-acyl-phospholipid synthase-like methyltransferase [Elusimicrobium simillimum]|uniref:SAM-dependent methyltransferase n=1 Tax=Elusimicrobium simillimum TaxID=3143438 RepID=UPI003C6F0C54